MAKLRPIDLLHIKEGRFIQEDGTTVFVQPALPGEKLSPGRVAYDPAVHHMKLKCSHCDVRVDFNKGSGAASCGANVVGSRPHLKKAPGQDHAKDCELPALQNLDSDSRIDKAIGFRIHLNREFGAESDPRGPVYKRAEGGKVYSFDTRLQPKIRTVDEGEGPQKLKFYRETAVVKSAKDIIGLMERGEHVRLKDSVVVNNTVMSWNSFAILDGDRLRGLVGRLLGGASHPVLMRMNIYKGQDKPYVESQPVAYGRTGLIVTRVYTRSATEDAFPTRGKYLVLGLPQVNFNRQSGVYELTMSVNDMAQVEPYNVGEILEAANTRRTRREQRTASLTP